MLQYKITIASLKQLSNGETKVIKMTKLVAVFTNKQELAKFIVGAKACDFETPTCGDVVCMVRFAVAVMCATDYVYSLADRLNGNVYESFA